jgi:phosphate-selective porin OprO/OprP
MILRMSSTAVLLVVGLMTAVCALADERDDRIRALEKRVEQLEKLLQGREAKPAPPGEAPRPAETPKPGPSLSVGASGFTMRSADSNFTLRLRGLLQVDSRWSDDDAVRDTFLIRRARPILEGTVYRDFDFRIAPDFAPSTPTLRDAWLNYRYSDALELRLGKMKPPGSLERWQAAANTLFIERGLPFLLWPVREVGFMFHGELWPGAEAATKSLGAAGVVNYELGLFNGTGDGRSAGNSDFDNDKSVEGRLFFHPFLKTGTAPLQKLGLGIAGTYGEMEGNLSLPDEFGFYDDVAADGLHWRVGPQAYRYWGPFGLLGEYSISSQRLERETAPFASTHAENHAWHVTASWLLTGEDATFRAVAPRKHFDPHSGGWGALQLVARYAYLDIDDGLFPTFADPAELPTRVSNWGVGLNWFLNRNIRAGFNYNHFDFKGGQSGSIGGLGENVYSTRVQLAF